MQQKRKNNLGIAGWLYGGRYGADRYVYALHRFTGLGMLFYFLMHIFVTGSRAGGPEKWESWMNFFDRSPVFAIGEFFVFIAFIFHAVNGIRLILVELGLMVGKPGLPAYPYGYSTLRQRPAMIGVLCIVAALAVIAGVDFIYLLTQR
jgi:succinate dehydrogenase / fumarate reductase cytochrome b subunit